MYKNWWILAINGLIAILFGLLLLAFPEAALAAVLFWFGLVLLFCGLVLVALTIRNVRKDKGSVTIILASVATIGLGLVILFQPTQSLKLFLVLVGIWALIIGIIQIVIYFRIRKVVANENILLINALVTLALGAVLFFIPIPFVRFIVILTGIFACLLGLMMVYFSFVLKKVKWVPEQHPTPAQESNAVK